MVTDLILMENEAHRIREELHKAELYGRCCFCCRPVVANRTVNQGSTGELELQYHLSYCSQCSQHMSRVLPIPPKCLGMDDLSMWVRETPWN